MRRGRRRGRGREKRRERGQSDRRKFEHGKFEKLSERERARGCACESERKGVCVPYAVTCKHFVLFVDSIFFFSLERYALYEIAHYRERCVSVRTFSNPSEVLEFLEPFAQSQLQKKIATESQQQHQQQC